MNELQQKKVDALVKLADDVWNGRITPEKARARVDEIFAMQADRLASLLPEAVRLVPVEPTPEMLTADAGRIPNRLDVWRAMVAAAPTPAPLSGSPQREAAPLAQEDDDLARRINLALHWLDRCDVGLGDLDDVRDALTDGKPLAQGSEDGEALKIAADVNDCAEDLLSEDDRARSFYAVATDLYNIAARIRRLAAARDKAAALLATPQAASGTPDAADGFAFDALVIDACKAAYSACDMGPFPEQAVDAASDKRFIGAALRFALKPQAASGTGGGDATLPFESALSDLIDAVSPGLDSGCVLADAKTAERVARASVQLAGLWRNRWVLDRTHTYRATSTYDESRKLAEADAKAIDSVFAATSQGAA